MDQIKYFRVLGIIEKYLNELKWTAFSGSYYERTKNTLSKSQINAMIQIIKKGDIIEIAEFVAARVNRFKNDDWVKECKFEDWITPSFIVKKLNNGKMKLSDFIKNILESNETIVFPEKIIRKIKNEVIAEDDLKETHSIYVKLFLLRLFSELKIMSARNHAESTGEKNETNK